MINSMEKNKVKYENEGDECNYQWGRYQEGLPKKMTFEQNPKRGDTASQSREVAFLSQGRNHSYEKIKEVV